MLISSKAGLCYLAAPKSASTSIEEQLLPHSDMIFRGTAHLKHLNVREFKSHIQPLLTHVGLPGIETCAVVRDPYDWLKSWYFYRRRDDELPIQSTAGIDFSDFIAGFAADNRPAFTHYVGTQFGFLMDETQTVNVDHIFLFEQLDRFHAFLSSRFGRQFHFARKNTSIRTPVSISAETESLIEGLFAKDLELYRSLLH